MIFRNEKIFHSNALAIIAGTGSAFLFFGLANIYAFFDDKTAFLGIGIISTLVGFGFFGWGLNLNKKYFGKIDLPKDRIFSSRPVRNDNFSIVIDGVGSFGNSENQAGVDIIANKAIKELINSGATIGVARFYSKNGSQNMLSD